MLIIVLYIVITSVISNIILLLLYMYQFREMFEAMSRRLGTQLRNKYKNGVVSRLGLGKFWLLLSVLAIVCGMMLNVWRHEVEVCTFGSILPSLFYAVAHWLTYLVRCWIVLFSLLGNFDERVRFYTRVLVEDAQLKPLIIIRFRTRWWSFISLFRVKVPFSWGVRFITCYHTSRNYIKWRDHGYARRNMDIECTYYCAYRCYFNCWKQFYVEWNDTSIYWSHVENSSK